MEQEYEKYKETNENLEQLMKENEMIFWEDDTAFVTLLGLLKVAIVWMESP